MEKTISLYMNILSYNSKQLNNGHLNASNLIKGKKSFHFTVLKCFESTNWYLITRLRKNIAKMVGVIF